MQVNLVFPPFALPTNPPLGIAHIKSYVERNNRYFNVKCIDLNLIFHDDLFECLKEIPSGDTFCKNDALLNLSGDVLRGKNHPLFFRKDSYHLLAGAFFNTVSAIHEHLSKECRSYIEEQRHDIDIQFLRKYVDRLLENAPSVIGFSVMMFEQLYCSLVLAKLIRAEDKNVKIILGGSYFSRDIEKLIIPMKEIDFIVHGEGERPLSDLLNNMEDPSSVKGIVYEKENTIVDTGYSFIEDLAEVPRADFSDFDLTSYFNPEISIPILSSRGCFWQRCAFCVHFYNFRDCYRERPVTDVVEELEFYADRGIKNFDFVDEMISACRLNQISEAIVERGLRINYYALAKPTKDFTKDILERMSASGCKAIFWGGESANQRVLNLMNKGTVVKDMSKVFEFSSLAGIRNHVFIIIGFPTETVEECNDTLSFLYQNRKYVDAVHWSRFSLQKDSSVFDNPGKFGITKIHDQHLWKNSYEYDVSVGLSQNEVSALVERNIDYFASFSAFSPFLNYFRDHALITYSRLGKDYDKFKQERVIENPMDCESKASAPDTGDPLC